MSYRVSNGAGTNFNTAANWDTGVNTPSIHATTNITITSGGVFSATFTAPNTTNASTGVLVPITAVGTAGNIIATLQENSAGFVDVAGATATIAITSLIASTHVFFKFTTPYVFTATTAGFYRIKLNTSGASGTTSVAADSGGSNFAYLTFMNSNVVPTTGDDVFLVSPNQGSEHIMSLDTSPSFGSGTSTAFGSFRSWGNGLVLANNGGLSWPAATSRTVTLQGNVINERGGKFRMGTAAAKIQAGVTARLSFEENGASVNYGFVHLNAAETTIQGADLTFKKTTLSSGVGTAASPIITADSVDWTVGDEITFVPMTDSATNYDETETRFIITKNSATSYVLSSTAGGAETALTFTHTNGEIFNLTRRCVIDTTDITEAWYADFAETSSASNVNLDGCRLESFGSTTTNKTTILFSNSTTEVCNVDDTVFYRNLSTSAGVTMNTSRIDGISHSWLIFYDAASIAFTIASLRNRTFTNLYVIDALTAGMSFSTTINNKFTDCGIWATCRSDSNRAVAFTNSTKNTFTRFNIHATRTEAMNLSSAVDLTFIDCEFGVDAENQSADINCTTDTYNIVFFQNCLFGSPTLIVGYTGMVDGSEVRFHKFNQTTNNHLWYTANGIARSTGAGLADTNVRTAGTFNVRIAPENTSPGFYWDFKVLAKASSAVSIYGFIQKNAAFSTDDVIAELYLPGLVAGLDTPSDTVTMPDNTSFNVFTLAATNTGSVPEYATVRIKGQTTTSSAFLYVADLFNGTNDITNLKTWDRGKPSDIMFEQLGDAAAVWAVLNSTLTTPGTTGFNMAHDLTVAKFLALK